MGFPSNSITALILLLSTLTSDTPVPSESPTPTPWPPQFHSILAVNFSGSLSLIDLWYDWPNGRNYNIIQDQLGELLYDVEWNNGSVYKFYKGKEDCRTFKIDVGILRPNWLDAATYLGQETVGGFLCNVWTKADFIWYYEDVVTKRPVHWVFYTGRTINVMTFEVGVVLEDAKWQAPAYCFQKNDGEPDRKSGYRLRVGYLEPETKDILKGSMQFDM